MNLLESGPGGPLPHRIIEWQAGSLRTTVIRNALEQLAFDLTDPSAWVEAFTRQPAPPSPSRWASYICLANEADVWA